MHAQAHNSLSADPNADATLAAARVHMTRTGSDDLLAALVFLEERERELAGLLPVVAGLRADPNRLALFHAIREREGRTGGSFEECAFEIEAGIGGDEIATATLRAMPGGEGVVQLRAPSTPAAAGFRGLAYSGGPVRASGGSMAIDLAGLMLKDEVPVLLNHSVDQIVGRARMRNSGIDLHIVEGRFSQVTEHGRQAAALMAEGHPWDLSVGMGGVFEACDAKRPTKLNGRAMNVDTILRRARLLEVSFVPAGADPAASASSLS